MKKIFISYARKHKDRQINNFINELIEKLKSYGCEVWIDQNDIKNIEKFDSKIEEGILNSEVVVYFITEESRSDYSFCLNEIQFSIINQKKILPVRLHSVSPPITICRINYMDFTNICEQNNCK